MKEDLEATKSSSLLSLVKFGRAEEKQRDKDIERDEMREREREREWFT